MTEPEWRPPAFRFWLPVTLLVTGYLITVLVVWCIDGMRNVGAEDPFVPWLVVLAASPFVAFVAVYGAVLRGWQHRLGRLLVATALTAPAAFLGLLVRAWMSGGM
jgi:hypothetical protein